MNNMTINVNNRTQTISENSTVEKLLQQLNIASNGIAVAVNNEIVSKEKWNDTILNNNDQLTIIQATQGG